MTRTYLDHAASSPLVGPAIDALAAHAHLVGNPAALHASGRAARAVLEDARERLAAAVGAHPTEVMFTSGGSEADAIAVHAGMRRGGRVLVGATEHPAVASAIGRWPDVEALGCDRDGVADLSGVDGHVALLSLMTVNNETGTIQPIGQAAEAAHRAGAWFHTDAVQALGHVPVDFAASGADMMSLSAHKVGGPVGIGALLVRRGLPVEPWGLGGAQEHGIRSGTQPAQLAASFAAAAELAVARQEAEAQRLGRLRRQLAERVTTTVGGTVVNGGGRVAPHVLNVTIERTRADDVLMLLDAAGFDCSTGSACRAGVHQPSDVLIAMGRSVEQASASIRFSLGPDTTAGDVTRLAEVLPDVVARARLAMGSLGEGTR